MTVGAATGPVSKLDVLMHTAALSSDVLGYASNYANYFSYYGSVTHPPCREGVNWSILKTPLAISQSDYAAVAYGQGGTARPTQPLAGREVCPSPLRPAHLSVVS